MNEYEKQANDFLAKTNTTIEVSFAKHDIHFDGDKDKRDIYNVTIKRGNRSFSFQFGQSLNCSGEYVCPRKLAYVEKLCGKFCLTAKEYGKLCSEDKSYFTKNKDFEAPTNYSILACLTKYEVGSLEDFCSEFGYDSDSKKADNIYRAVSEEYKNVCCIWGDDEIDELQEIS